MQIIVKYFLNECTLKNFRLCLLIINVWRVGWSCYFVYFLTILVAKAIKSQTKVKRLNYLLLCCKYKWEPVWHSAVGLGRRGQWFKSPFSYDEAHWVTMDQILSQSTWPCRIVKAKMGEPPGAPGRKGEIQIYNNNNGWINFCTSSGLL